jgi:hypothetical protein
MPAGSASSTRACLLDHACVQRMLAASRPEPTVSARALSGCCCSFTCSGTHTGPGPGDAGKRREDTAGRLKQLGISSKQLGRHKRPEVPGGFAAVSARPSAC